eukprot:GHVL01005355.1.p1 GENE.GHVL01005355.1~~GHVL01005355.1.p1  ORF type:complete len:211 (+),score=37.64 GHVL01005355.1:101-733(+)
MLPRRATISTMSDAEKRFSGSESNAVSPSPPIIELRRLNTMPSLSERRGVNIRLNLSGKKTTDSPVEKVYSSHDTEQNVTTSSSSCQTHCLLASLCKFHGISLRPLTRIILHINITDTKLWDILNLKSTNNGTFSEELTDFVKKKLNLLINDSEISDFFGASEEGEKGNWIMNEFCRLVVSNFIPSFYTICSMEVLLSTTVFMLLNFTKI